MQLSPVRQTQPRFGRLEIDFPSPTGTPWVNWVPNRDQGKIQVSARMTAADHNLVTRSASAFSPKLEQFEQQFPNLEKAHPLNQEEPLADPLQEKITAFMKELLIVNKNSDIRGDEAKAFLLLRKADIREGMKEIKGLGWVVENKQPTLEKFRAAVEQFETALKEFGKSIPPENKWLQGINAAFKKIKKESGQEAAGYNPPVETHIYPTPVYHI